MRSELRSGLAYMLLALMAIIVPLALAVQQLHFLSVSPMALTIVFLILSCVSWNVYVPDLVSSLTLTLCDLLERSAEARFCQEGCPVEDIDRMSQVSVLCLGALTNCWFQHSLFQHSPLLQ